ncbi:BspA family leucine-rich repeat surface protein [Aquimarina algiphila]|uniref:BspA family leucine-rich repeat surface protein n=1 Tax=Aquimarina algiphila TaxID=2047982 RepID=UPI00232C3F6A|nr:BspA family leucine-rich repeat surface protein [Aquimarina algiphila]
MKHFYITLFFIVSFFTTSFAQNEFITTWETTTADESITIPTTGSGYNYTVDWGDGTIETGFTGNATHEYAVADIYTVKITGDFPRIYFNNNADSDKILTVEQWGNIAWTSMENAFNDCKKLRIKATDAPDLSRVTNLRNAFRACQAFRDEDFSNWDVSNVTNMPFVFFASSFNGDVSTWDVGSVTNFISTFAISPFNQNISNWNIGERVTGTINMGGMFLRGRQFNQNLGSWDISKVSNMNNMFSQSSLSTTNYDATLIGWATQDPGETIPSNISISFEGSQYCLGADARNTLTDPTGLNWSITDDGVACASTDFFITTWQTTTDNENIVIPTTGSGYDYSVDWGDGTIETGFTGNATHEYTTSGTYTVRIIGDFPRIYFNDSGDKDKILNVTQWGSIAWNGFNDAFSGCSNLDVIATDAPDLSNVTSVSRMFRECTTLGTSSMLDFSNWDTSSVVVFGGMFRNASNFNSTSITNWDVGKATGFVLMFENAITFNQDISNWNIGENVTGTVNLGSMLINAENFDQNLGAWNIEKVTNIRNMLGGTGLSTANYDATLIGWAENSNTPSGLDLGVSNLTYCLAEVARNTLTDIGGLNWSISDAGLDCADAFITTWKTTATNESITIPTTGSGYDYFVDWGDGTVETGITGNATHSYSIAGTYTVKILGDFPQFASLAGGISNAEKLRTVEQWGNIEWRSMFQAFSRCSNMNITAIDAPNLSNVTVMGQMFFGCTNLQSPDFSNWDTSSVTSMTWMFINARNFNGNISTWDVGNVIAFDLMLAGTRSFNQDIGGWNIGENVAGTINMNGMLTGTASFNQSLGDWNLEKVTDIDDMLTNSGLSTANYDSTLIGWAANANTPNNLVLGADSFTYCFGETARNTLTSAPYNWTISDAGLDCSDAFITTWQTTTVSESITIPTTGSGYNYVVDWGDGTVDFGLTGNATHEYTTAGAYTVRIIGDFPRFYNPGLGGYISNAAKIQSIEQWGTQQWTSMEGAFDSATSLVINATDIPDLSAVTSMQGMFFLNSNLVDNGGTIGTWDVSNVQDMGFLFRNTPFNEDISSWNTQNVTNMSNMLANCPNFNQNLGDWDMSKVTNMSDMFVTSGLSLANYDATLIGWATDSSGNTTDGVDDVPSNITFHAGSSMYCLGVEAHNTLTSSPHNWTITDGGTTCATSDFFITTWQTTIANESITIPTTGSGYNYSIDWGDGTIEAGFTGNATHEYVVAGAYTVKITGDFPRIYFNNTGDRNKISSIEQWGNIAWRNFQYAFSGCTQLKINAIDAPDLSNVTNLNNMFRSCTSLDTPDFSNWDTSTITTMKEMFYRANNFDGNIANWDVGKVISFELMFYEAFKFNQNISSWNIGEFVSTKIINMNSMFSTATSFNQPIGNWELSKVSNIRSMFFRAAAFNRPLDSWDVSGMGTLKRLFFSASSFNQPLDSWDVSTISNMDEMFWGASSFNQNLGNWDISETTIMNRLFLRTAMSTANYDATLVGWATLEAGETQIPANLILDASSFYCLAEDARNTLTSAPYNWSITDEGLGCVPTDFFITTWQTTTPNESITIPVVGSGYNYGVDWGDGTVETGITGDVTHTFATAGIQTIKITGDFPAPFFTRLTGDDEGKLLTVEQWGTQQWTSMRSAFDGCYNLKLNAEDTPDLSQVTRMSGMFRDCTNLEDLKDTMNAWDMTTIESISSMFNGCTLFNENIGGWTFTSLTDAFNAFEAAATFNQDISNWDVSKVDEFDAMFKDATSFNQPIGKWTLGTVDYIDRMFQGATAFNQDLGNWDFSNVYVASDMFNGATAFDQDLSAWDISNVEELDNFFTGSGMSRENYDKTLIGWATLEAGENAIPTDLTLNADATYC